MRKTILAILAVCCLGSLCSCNDYETYGDKKEKERKAIRNFIADSAFVVIPEKQFHDNGNVTDVNKACDFFTYYLLEGAGYDMQNHSSTGSCPADSDADKKLTLSEMFAYAKKQVTANMKNFKSKSWFHGDASQTPCIYEGSNGGLVLFQYA